MAVSVFAKDKSAKTTPTYTPVNIGVMRENN